MAKTFWVGFALFGRQKWKKASKSDFDYLQPNHLHNTYY